MDIEALHGGVQELGSFPIENLTLTIGKINDTVSDFLNDFGDSEEIEEAVEDSFKIILIVTISIVSFSILSIIGTIYCFCKTSVKCLTCPCRAVVSAVDT